MKNYFNRLAKASVVTAAILMPGMEANAFMPLPLGGPSPATNLMTYGVVSSIVDDESFSARELHEAIADPAKKPVDLQKLGVKPSAAKHISLCRDQSGLQQDQDKSIRLSKVDEIMDCLDKTSKEYQLLALSPKEAIAEGMEESEASRYFECRQEMGIENGQPLKSAFKAKVQDCALEKKEAEEKNGLGFFLVVIMFAGAFVTVPKMLFGNSDSKKDKQETAQDITEKMLNERAKKIANLRKHRPR
jgi:hypothetical protein